MEKDPWDYIPMTYLIKNGSEDETFIKFKEETSSMPKGKPIHLFLSKFRNVMDH